MEGVLARATKMKSTVEAATEVEEANKMKTVMKEPTKSICAGSIILKEISVKEKNELTCVGRKELK